jgi:TonB family protein
MGYQALLFCPDEKTARTVTNVLNDLDFTVEPCTEPFGAVKKLMAQHFDAVVVDCDNEQNATLLFKSARNSTSNQSSLAVAVVEGQAGVAKAFRIGANLVLTKPINVEQAKGTLRVARGLLRKGSEAKGAAKGSGPGASPAPTPSTPAAAPGAAPKPTKPSAPPARSTTPAAPSTLVPGFAKTPAKSAPTPLQISRPQASPPVAPVTMQPPRAPAATQTAQVDDYEPDTILEADDTEILDIPSAPAAKPPVLPTAATPASTSKFAWQPSKPMAEPMGSALQRAAEAAGKLDGDNAEAAAKAPSFGTEPSKASSGAGTKNPSPAFGAQEDRPAAPTGLSFHAAASAPAPAREKPQATPPPPAFTEPVPAKAPALQVNEIKIEEKPEAAESSSPAYYSGKENEPAPPTFFPGAYDPEEVEGGGKIKAIVIVAMVVLLGCSAAYLSWRNMTGKGSPIEHPAPTTAAPTTSAPKPDAGQPSEKPSAGQPEVNDITLGGANNAPAAKSSPSGKASAKPSAATPEDDSEPEVTQRLIVKNDTRSAPKPAAPQDEPVQEPTVALGAAPDAKALAGLSNGPAHTPTPAPQVIRVSQGVMEGLILKRVQPRYPAQAMQMRIQGSVQLQATISKNGDITNLKVINGDGILARSAQEAVKQWKYKPYYLNSEPVEIQTQILVNFKLPN